MRKLSSLLVLLSLLGGTGGCGPWGGTRPVVKIGLVAPFEGLYRPLGYEVLPAVKLALREWNEGGGVGGYTVQLVALNDGQDPAIAAQRAREMVVDPDIMGVIGHFADETTLAALPTYDQASLALVATMATAVDVTRMGCRQTFRLGADNNLLGRTAAHYAVAERGARRMAVIRGEEDLVNSFIAAAQEEGGVIVLDAKIDEGDFVTALAGERPELVFFGGEALDAGELLLRFAEAGLDIPLLGGEGLNSPHLVQVAGDRADGTAYVTITPPVEDQDFIDAYAALSGGAPGPHAALAYDATQVLLNALRRAIAAGGKPTRQGVVAALAQAEGYDGLTGYISFDERGQSRNPRVYIYEIVDGRYPGVLSR